jgi:hypothetical protein
MKQQSAVERIHVDMDNDLAIECMDVDMMELSQQIASKKQRADKSRLLEESESFLASLHSSPNLDDLDLQRVHLHRAQEIDDGSE